MATIYNTTERAASREQPGVVYIDLLWDESVQSAPLNASEQRSVNGSVRVSTNNDGYWEIDNIDPNSEITPSNNIYLIREHTDGEYIDFYANIPTNDTFWLGDVVVPMPLWVDDA